MSDYTPLPWTMTGNSWQYTSIYDAGGHVVCRLDLEDWGVTEESQDRLEKAQAEAAELIIKAVNLHETLVRALTDILDSRYASDNPYEIARAALALVKWTAVQ